MSYRHICRFLYSGK